MEFFSRIQKDVSQKEFKQILGRVTTLDEQMSLNIQAAAYLTPQLSDRSKIVIGFDRIEEASRPVWVNHVAAKYYLPGFVNFVSMQIPGFEVDLKMGKSNPFGSLKVGDSLSEVILKLTKMHGSRSGKFFLLYTIESLFKSKPLPSTVEVDPESNWLKITLPTPGIVSPNKDALLFEDWFILLNRIRLAIAQENQMQTVGLQENLGSFLQKHFGSKISFLTTLHLAQLISTSAKFEKLSNGNLSVGLSLDALLNTKTKMVTGSAEALYEFTNNHPKFDLDKLKVAAVNALTNGHKNVFPLGP